MWLEDLLYKLSGGPDADAAGPRTTLERHGFHLFKDEGLRLAPLLPWRWADPLAFCASLTKLLDYSPWGRKESDTTKHAHTKLLVAVSEMRLANTLSSFMIQTHTCCSFSQKQNEKQTKNKQKTPLPLSSQDFLSYFIQISAQILSASHSITLCLPHHINFISRIDSYLNHGGSL